jgi:hypothetical protein
MEHSRHAAAHKPMPHSLPPVGRLSGVGFFLSPLPEAGGGEGEGEERGVVARPIHPHSHPPPSRGREKKGRFCKNLPQKAFSHQGEGVKFPGE